MVITEFGLNHIDFATFHNAPIYIMLENNLEFTKTYRFALPPLSSTQNSMYRNQYFELDYKNGYYELVTSFIVRV